MIKWPGKKQILHAMLLLPFVVLSLIAVLHHEPWRDETHTVQMVNEVGVLEAIKIINATERQPPLWHIALGLVKHVPDSLRYEPLHKGLRAIVALLVLRNKVLIPLLAKQGRRYNGPHCHMDPINMHYDDIQKEMQHAFKILGIAA